MYKALFLDLDGTTVAPFTDAPSPRVKHAIEKLRNKVHVCLATGRLFHQAQPVIDHLNLNGLCVIANGIQIYDPTRKKIIKEIALSQKEVPLIYNLLKKYSHQIHTFDGEVARVRAQIASHKILSFFIENISPHVVEKIIKDLERFPSVIVHKLLAADQNLLSIEVCSARGTKQHGIVDVAKRLNISTHEIIGVGDGYNDFPLLLACGLKFAMGNAVAELKAIADFVAPSVENDGVAVIIEKFILPLLRS